MNEGALLIAKDNITLGTSMSKMGRVTRALQYCSHLCSGAMKIKRSHMPSPFRVAWGHSDVSSSIQEPPETATFPVSLLDSLTAILNYSKTPGKLLGRWGQDTEVRC